MKQSTKTILMTILIFAASTFAGLFETLGAPTKAIDWQVLGLTTLFSVAAYSVQSFWLPSTSVQGSINALDWVKGAIVALCNVGSSIIAANISGTVINWNGVLGASGAVLLGYMIKQFKSLPIGIPPTK